METQIKQQHQITSIYDYKLIDSAVQLNYFPMQFYTRSDLEVFNLLQHPTWIFDVTRKEMFWANHVALRIWNTATLEMLLNRDYKTDMSEATE